MALPARRSAGPRAAIPTVYRDVRFRSRLEARWAAFFDELGWPWVYEPFDTEDWIPDFLINGPNPFLVEVGPCWDRGEYRAKASKPLAAFPPVPTYCERMDHKSCLHDDDYVLGWVPDRVTLVVGIHPVFETPAGEAAGLLTDDGHGRGLAPGLWGRCSTCGQVSVVHATGSRTAFACGHGNHDALRNAIIGRGIFDAWNRAANFVQWRPARGRPRR